MSLVRRNNPDSKNGEGVSLTTQSSADALSLGLITLEGPPWPEPVIPVHISNVGKKGCLIRAYGKESGREYSRVLQQEELKEIASHDFHPSFDANPTEFRLALEAFRLRMAENYDPLFAVNNSDVDPLPHQLEAVYDVMLPQPRIRHLMAHDAGGGKTIMAGLLYRELEARDPNLRVLILCPAALTGQWQRELEEKFFRSFIIVDSNTLANNENIWQERRKLITSVHFARQDNVRRTLASVCWDLVIIDEAHHLSAYENYATKSYHLGKTVAANTEHILLATATPHKGDSGNFLKLLQLLDPYINSVDSVKNERSADNPLMLRRLKEEMIDEGGRPLFKRRTVVTRLYAMKDVKELSVLYNNLTRYVSKTYRAADRQKNSRIKSNTSFAMTILQRRMASSVTALKRSLERRLEKLNPEVGETIEEENLWYAYSNYPEHELWDVEYRSEAITPYTDRESLEKEKEELQKLIASCETVLESGSDLKLKKLSEIMREAGINPASNEKLLVFTEFKDTLKYLVKYFTELGFEVATIDGSMEQQERRNAELDFQYRAQIMVATEAAGEGINLQFCSIMVNYDIPWTPPRIEQRMGRIHRYGQKRDVYIYNLVAYDTREGHVLSGLLKRLDEMKNDLSDRVFDVVSELIAEKDMKNILAEVSTSKYTEAPQFSALQRIEKALNEGKSRYQSEVGKSDTIPVERYRKLNERSYRERMTPEYAQNHFIQAVTQFGGCIEDDREAHADPGDALSFTVTASTPTLARALGTLVNQKRKVTFYPSEYRNSDEAVLNLSVGEPHFEFLQDQIISEYEWVLLHGARLADPHLLPGRYYFLWFFRGTVLDGEGNQVKQRLFAIREEDDGSISPAAPVLLHDISSEAEVDVKAVPAEQLPGATRAHFAWQDCVDNDQFFYLERIREIRKGEVEWSLRPVIENIEKKARELAEELSTAAFDGSDDDTYRKLRQTKIDIEQVLENKKLQAEKQGWCSLGRPELVGIALVQPPRAETTEPIPDERPDVAKAAEDFVRQYEQSKGRKPVDVSGEHEQYPFDIESTGPGGPRYIEVKGTTEGDFFLSENERRAARHLGGSYYLYIVCKPLENPELYIIKDPLSKMQHDSRVAHGVSYLFTYETWSAVKHEDM